MTKTRFILGFISIFIVLGVNAIVQDTQYENMIMFPLMMGLIYYIITITKTE